MNRNWGIFAIWLLVSAALYFGALALEMSVGGSEDGGGEEAAVSAPSDDQSSDRQEKERKKKEKKEKRERKEGGAEDTGDARQPTVASIAAAMSAIRGLPLKEEIKVTYLDRDELQERIEEEFASEYTPGEVEAQEKTLKALDLIGPEVDLLEAMQELLVDQIVGFYDDETRELALISSDEEIDLMNEVTLSHEITHALQDQSFALGSFYPIEGPVNNSDAEAARLALVEGDASLAMTEYVESELSAMDLLGLGLEAPGGTVGLLGVPEYLDDALLFPYVSGEEFVAFLKEKGGWEAVNGAYSNLPESTEQILHPERYIAGDHPVPVGIPDLTGLGGPGWEFVYDDSFGEFDLRELLSTTLRMSDSIDAAEGWGGGRVSHYERSDGAGMTVILLTWDSAEEADEFTMAMWEYLETGYCSYFEFYDRQFPILYSCDGDYWVMAKRGTAVVVARVPDRTLANLVPATVLNVEPGDRPVSERMPEGSMLTLAGGAAGTS